MQVWIVVSHGGRHLQRLEMELATLPEVKVSVIWRDYHFEEFLQDELPDFIVASGLCKTRRFAEHLYGHPFPWPFLQPFRVALSRRIPVAWVREPTQIVVRRIKRRMARLQTV